MAESTLISVRARRSEIMLDEFVDQKVRELMLNAKTTMANPHAMKKLAPLIKFYAKKPHPFTSCVRDNRKRFGPLTEKYCAVIVDLIHGGNTHWRRGRSAKLTASDEQPPVITDDVIELLDSLDQPTKERLDMIYLDAWEVAHS